MEEIHDITLGMKVRDTVTGFIGTVTSITHYLDGGARCAVETLNGEYKVVAEYFELSRVEPLTNEF